LFVPPLLGATVVFEPSTNPAEVVRTIKRERATAMVAVPRMLDGLRAGMLRDLEARGDGEWFRGAFDSAKGQSFLPRAWKFGRVHRRFGWKFWALISGGAALSSETEEFFRRVGYAVVQGYGMTETASLISLNHPFRAAQGTIGKVLPGREFRLANDGEILVRGENVAGGYWEVGALRPSDDREWLRTGDVGELDAEGNLHFRGRKKNVIVTPAGLNVYPEDLEGELRKQAGVRDCAVIPMDRGGNAEPCAVLLMNDGGEVAAGRAVENANKSLAGLQRMLCWVVWPEMDFPRTATGKPRLAEVAAAARRLLGATIYGTTDATKFETNEVIGTSGDLENLLHKFLRARNSSTRLESDLNLTSLDRVELMSALEERYQVELSETAFADARTVGDVKRLLREPSAQRAEYAYPRWALRAPVKWFRLAVYYALVWPATLILGHPKIVGRENLANVRGPVLVISNHITRRADIGLILAALPPKVRHQLATAMGGETLQRMRRPPVDWFFAKRWAFQLGYWLVTALFNVFPLPQLSGFRESFRFAGEAVDRGYSILVFPEGEVNSSETGAMVEFQSGIGLLAENLNIPVVPMRMDGVWKMKREGRRLARPGEITVRIGPTITFPFGTAPDAIARALEDAVRAM
jgi:long-chain acyl-CoA synthetase